MPLRFLSNSFVNISEALVRHVTSDCGIRHRLIPLSSVLSAYWSPMEFLMCYDTASVNLLYILKQRSEKVSKPSSTVLFQRGDKASGMFVVLSGKVSLDLGVDSAIGRTCGPGALVGLPSTLTRHNYSMTATVTEDAELGFWSPDALDSLLHNRPDLCQPLLALLGERIAENHEVWRALLTGDKQPVL